MFNAPVSFWPSHGASPGPPPWPPWFPRWNGAGQRSPAHVDLHHVQLQEIYRCVIPVIHLHVPVHMHMNMWYICISIEHLSILDLFLPFSHDPAVASGSGEAHRTGAFTWDLKGSIILHLSTKGIVDVHILSYISIYNSEYKYWVFRNGVELNRHKCFLVSILYKILRLRCVVYAIFTKKNRQHKGN